MRLLQTLTLLTLIGTTGLPHADDLEVYANASSVPRTANILFVFDNSASMNKTPLGTAPTADDPSRLDILKAAIDEILGQPFDPPINVGYMNFRNWRGSGVKFPIAGIDSDAHDIDPGIPVGTTVRSVIRSLVGGSQAGGETPTVEALFEAALYFRGDEVDRGRWGTFGQWGTTITPPGYVNSAWTAANPASYSGADLSSTTYVDPTTPLGNGVSEATCHDYSARPDNTTNHCAAIPDNLLYDCTTYGVEACTTTTRDVCVSTSHPVQDICLNGPADSTTPWLNGDATHCCTAADATNAECLQWQNLARCDAWQPQEVCEGGRTENEVYTECRYRHRYIPNDTRRYNSPIGIQCQKNAIILLSDGAPSKNSLDLGAIKPDGSVAAPARIRELIFRGTNAVAPAAEQLTSVDEVGCADLSSTIFNRNEGGYRWGNCGPELAQFLHRYDQSTTIPNSTVETHTVGFGIHGPGAAESQAYLRLLAENGGGRFYEATNTSELIASITSIISSVANRSHNMSGLALGIDRNRLSTGNKTYLGQFLPSNERSWEGNVKGYFLEGRGIVDVNGEIAVTADGKTFNSSAQSFWSAAPDGASVLAGGLRNRLDPFSRTLYVNTRDDAPNNLHLAADPELLLTVDNPALTNVKLGLPATADTTTRQALIEWARSAQMKAPLHTTPAVVHYGGDIGDILFIATNQGYLHAFDVTHPTTTGDDSGGRERFAFMPRALIPNLAAMKANGSSGTHLYGLDGPLTVLAHDQDDDGELTSIGDRVILYFGMRRGGNAYYALDVSNPDDPILLWRLDPTVEGFAGLGQSWSRMVPTTIRDGNGSRKVLIFGGGYDPDQDGYADRHADDIGAGLFIVDAYSGELIMSFGEKKGLYLRDLPDMRYSIPAAPRVIDIDGDRLADRIYVADIGGQIFSIDLPADDAITDPSAYLVHRVADLGGGKEKDNRRFYYPPAVARVMRNGSPRLALAIGSGYRAHPLNNATQDNFFLLFDAERKSADALPPTLKRDKLYDLTIDRFGRGNDPADIAVAASDLAKKDGWFISLPKGHKVLSEARIVSGTVMFNVFSATGSVCADVSTRNDFYMVSLLDARALVDLDDIDEPVTEDRWVTLDFDGIATTPSLVFSDPAANAGWTPSMDIYVGQERVFRQAQNIFKVFWKSLN